jgi:hypothetical protein
MLTIREEQEEAFRQVALHRFEGEMVEHLRGFAPKLCEIRGESCVRQVIRLAIRRAGQYGFTNRGPVRFYIELMFTLGCDFDTDFQYPWVQATLRDPEPLDQAVRAERLYSQFQHYMEHVAGPNKQYTLDALRKISQAKLDDARTLLGDFEARVITALERIHPQKCNHVGEPILHALVRKGVDVASVYKVTSELGAAVLVALMFGFGNGVTADLLYPWVPATLSDPLVKDANARAERLYTKSRIYVGRLLAYLEAEQRHV